MPPIVLDATKYKKTTVSRGFSYNYYYSPAQEGKLTLLFAHGFPSTSVDWAGVVSVLEPEGYGIIVPDMLGYAGTDKPTDPAQYVGTGIARDLVDLLNVEGIDKAVAIGHDWGSLAVSRVMNLSSERILGFAFLTVGYIAPFTTSTLLEMSKAVAEKLGYNPLGYIPFMATHEKLIEQHMDSFMDMMFSEDPGLHRQICPEGAALAWVGADKRSLKLSSPVATPEWTTARHQLLASGMAAPTCWYKVQTSTLSQMDNKKIPQEAYFINKPVFFGACTKDAPSPPVVGDRSLKMFAKGPVTRHEYDTGHWVMLTHYAQLGKDLSAWLKSLCQA